MRPFQRLAVAGALLAFAVGLPLSAQMPEIPVGKWWKRPRVVEMLKITSDQQERLEEIFSKNRRAFIDLKADVERRQIDVEELMAKKDADPKKISSAIDALDQARLRLGKARTMMIVEMKGILTADQWQVILDKTDEWKREREEGKAFPFRRRAPGGPAGPGGRGRPDGTPRDGGDAP